MGPLGPEAHPDRQGLVPDVYRFLISHGLRPKSNSDSLVTCKFDSPSRR